MFSQWNENRAGSGTKPPPLPTIQAEEAMLHEKMVPVFEPVFLYLSAGSLRRRGRLRRCGADSGGTPAEETRTGGETTEPGRVTETFRLVTVGDGDDPASVLAGTDGGAGAVYTLDLFSVEDLTIEGYTQEEMDLLDWSPMPALWWRSPGTAPLWSPTPCGSARWPPFASWRTALTICAGCTWTC